MSGPENFAVARTPRLTAVDATRGIALLGMVAVHSLYEERSPGHPSTSYLLFGGRAAAAFAVLAGVGIAFITGRRRVRRIDFGITAAMLGTRALVIGTIGLLLGYTDASLAVVILPFYALLFLFALPLVFLPSWAVASVGIAVAAVVPPLTHLLRPRLPVPGLDNFEFGDVVKQPLQYLSELTITGEYPALAWIAYICAGLVIGRLTLSRLKVAITLLGTGVIFAAGAAAVSWVLLHRFGGLTAIWSAQPASGLTVPETTELLNVGGDGTTPTSTAWWLAIDGPHTGTTADLIGTTGTAFAVLGLLLLSEHMRGVFARRAIAVALAPLAAAGSMTLTFYTVHIVFLNSDYDVYTPAAGYALQVAGVLLVGLAWRATAGKGPLEALVSAIVSRAKRWVEPPRHQEPVSVDGPV
ncbi:heparan-alpha-glucosaminide N-acetyltransferase domain-containing protein [Amycolatopsis azurea]|uniref:heparan-alpha-glucosaminide N-acetyltransferase domain-containing protein n=1 Tax=Amycolatopsis azurea TaxID=36819 RepID=UPI0037FE09F8